MGAGGGNMARYNYWCLNPECPVTVLLTLESNGFGIPCKKCGVVLTYCGRPAHAIRPDYSDISNFGKPQYADARRRQCGMSGDVPPDTFHKDDLQ